MIGDDEFILFGRTTADHQETIERMVEAIPFYEAVSVSPDGDDLSFQLRVSEPPVLSVIASVGGSVEEAEIRDGDYRLRVHLSPSSETRLVTDAMQETYPNVNLLKRQQHTKERVAFDTSSMTEELTDRQQTVLEAAYYAGFFEWPRDASGEDVADSLDIAPPTFHQHLRKAEAEVFRKVVSDPNNKGLNG
jgi:predicted DNA binding protein